MRTLGVVLVFLFSIIGAVHASETYQLRVTAEISADDAKDSLYIPHQAKRVQVDVIYNLNAIRLDLASNYAFENPVIAGELTFIDAFGSEIGVSGKQTLSQPVSVSRAAYWVPPLSSEQRFFTYWWPETDASVLSYQLNLVAHDGNDLFGNSLGNQWLALTEFDNDMTFKESELVIAIRQQGERTILRLNIDVISIETIGADSDGDGVNGSNDMCPESLLDETVYFAGINTGVPNRVDELGCSLMDYYAACEEASNSPARNLFSYQGPTACQTNVGYTLFNSGRISYTELRMLRSAM